MNEHDDNHVAVTCLCLSKKYQNVHGGWLPEKYRVPSVIDLFNPDVDIQAAVESVALEGGKINNNFVLKEHVLDFRQ